MIRDDKEGQTDNTCYRWEVGDAAATERAFAQADVVSSLKLHYPRSHPSPIECCGSIADYDAGTGKLTVYMTTQAPHIIRAAVALVAELPEHMIRIVSPDIGGGFGNKVPIYPGYVAVDPGLDPARQAGEVDRGQVRQPVLHGLRPRHVPRRADGAALRRQDPRRPDARRHRPGRVLRRRPAEQVQGRAAALGVRLLQRAGRAHHRAGPLHEQGARRRGLPVLVPGDRGDVLPGAHGRRRGRRPRHRRRRDPPPQPPAATTSSRTAPRSASSSTPGSTTSAWSWGWTRSATRSSSATRWPRANAAGCSASASRP